MALKTKEPRAHDAEAVAVTDIYKTVRADADQELADMRNNLTQSHQLGLIAGRAQAFGAMKLLTEFLEYKQVFQIIENDDYLKIPGVTSRDDYFEKLGLSRSEAYRKLKIARTLTAEEVSLLGHVGFTRRDLLSYAALPEEKRLEIREGKVINIESASREEIKDVIEEIIAAAHNTKEDLAAQLSAKDKVLKTKTDLINKQERDLRKYEKEAASKGLTPDEDAFLQLMANKSTSFEGYMLALDPDFLMGNAGEITPRMRACLIASLHYMKMQVLAAYDTAVLNYGSPNLNPELMDEFEQWEKTQGMQAQG